MSIHQEVQFDASPDRVYDALMDGDKHGSFTGAPAEISRDEGGRFACFDGQIVGHNIELVPNKRIVQTWRFVQWPAGTWSLVRFELVPEGDGTRLVLDHEAVPEPFQEGVAGGWHGRYWGQLKEFLAH